LYLLNNNLFIEKSIFIIFVLKTVFKCINFNIKFAVLVNGYLQNWSENTPVFTRMVVF